MAPIDWSRFDSRAPLVHVLEWNDVDGELHPEVFANILIYRPSTTRLLPQLEVALWTASHGRTVVHLLPMVSSTLTSLDLHITSSPGIQPFVRLLEGMEARGVRLETFKLRLEVDIVEVDDHLSSFITCQQQLRFISLPHYFGSESIVSALGVLPHLERVDASNFRDADPDGMHWEFSPTTFRRLKSFAWTDENLNRATNLLHSPPPQLEELSLSVFQELPDNPAIGVFVTSLVGAFQNIRSLQLNFFTDAPGEQEIRVFESFESLLQCKRLDTLVIHDNLAMSIWEGDVIRMAEAWPKLRKLLLTPDPTETTEVAVGNPITLLAVFARFFGPEVEELGWYVAMTDPNDIVGLVGTATLPGLHTLHVGTSLVGFESLSHYAAFLAGICPPGLAICAGESLLSTPFTDSRVPPTWRNTVAATKGLWEAMKLKVETIQLCLRPLRYQLELASISSRPVRE